jgi:hypothetical protein
MSSLSPQFGYLLRLTGPVPTQTRQTAARFTDQLNHLNISAVTLPAAPQYQDALILTHRDAELLRHRVHQRLRTPANQAAEQAIRQSTGPRKLQQALDQHVDQVKREEGAIISRSLTPVNFQVAADGALTATDPQPIVLDRRKRTPEPPSFLEAYYAALTRRLDA